MNVGIIGSGKIVPIFIENVKQFKDFKLRAIFARNTKRLKELTDKYNIEYYTDNYDEILNDDKIDVLYIALPNARHYEYAKKGLLHNKHIIMEKPFTDSYKTSKELIDIAKRKKLIIFEAITTLYLPNFLMVKKKLNEVGKIKIIELNYSQYSSRYDDFRKGILAPVFDYKESGGALYDLGVYNVHFVVGLFGKPLSVSYYPNIQRRVDTSGTLIMKYKDFVVSAIAAKDCHGVSSVVIEGEDGLIKVNDGSNTIRNINVNGHEYNYDDKSVYYYELKEFIDIYKKKDLVRTYLYNKETLMVMKVLDEAYRGER